MFVNIRFLDLPLFVRRISTDKPYQDIVSGDEIVADTFNLVPNKDFDILWECDCRKYLKRANEDFQLEGANPSAEDAEDEGGEGEATMVHDIEDQFRLVWLKVEDGAKPSKESYKAHIKCMLALWFSLGLHKSLTFVLQYSLP